MVHKFRIVPQSTRKEVRIHRIVPIINTMNGWRWYSSFTRSMALLWENYRVVKSGAHGAGNLERRVSTFYTERTLSSGDVFTKSNTWAATDATWSSWSPKLSLPAHGPRCKRCPVTQVHLVSNIECCIPFEPPWNSGFSRDIGTFREIHDFPQDFRDLEDGPEFLLHLLLAQLLDAGLFYSICCSLCSAKVSRFSFAA